MRLHLCAAYRPKPLLNPRPRRRSKLTIDGVPYTVLGTGNGVVRLRRPGSWGVSLLMDLTTGRTYRKDAGDVIADLLGR